MKNNRMPDFSQVEEQEDELDMFYQHHKKVTKFAIAIYFLGILIFVLSHVLSYSCIKNLKEEIKVITKEKEDLEEKNLKLYEENQESATAYESSISLLKEVAEVAVELDKDNQKIVNLSKKQKRMLNKLQKRKKLMNKYEWALYNEDGKTDISFEDIETLRSLCKKKNLSDDTVDLVLAIAMTESTGDAKCTNPNSTALGLGQFIEETGRIAYTVLMGHDSYNHKKVAVNGTTNLKMIVYYLEYLDMKTNGDIDKVIDYYRGLRSEGYKKKINKYLSNNNKSLLNIKITE